MHIISVAFIAILTLQAQVDGSFFSKTEDVDRLKKFYGDNIFNSCSKNVDITRCVANALKVLRTYSDTDDNNEASCACAVKSKSEMTKTSDDCTSAIENKPELTKTSDHNGISYNSAIENESVVTKTSEDYPAGEKTDELCCDGENESFYEDEYDYFEKLANNNDYECYDGPYAAYFNDSCFKELSNINDYLRDSFSRYDYKDFTNVCSHFYEVMKFCHKKTFTYENMVPRLVYILDKEYCRNEQVLTALGAITRISVEKVVAAYAFAFGLVGLTVVWLYYTDR